jgi:hypothetical protein
MIEAGAVRGSRSLSAMIFPMLCLALSGAGGGALDAAPVDAPLGSDLSGRSVPDTVLSIAPGDVVRLLLSDGRVILEGVDGAGLEVDDGSRRGIEWARNGDRLTVRVRGRDRGGDRFVRVGVPRGVAVEVSGEHVALEARGMRGDLSVTVIEGDLRVSDARGAVDLRTVDGDVEVVDVEGSVDAGTVDGWVAIRRVRGSIRAQSMDGDVILDDVDGAEVTASTVDGDVTYDGLLSRGSRVDLVTHDGDVVVSIPADASADVEVATFDGEFIPEFPVQVGRVEAGQPLRFRLGAGGARLDVQVFDGDIQLRHRSGR